jgi:general secretion pathway protein L
MRTLILQLPLELPQAPTSYLHAWVQADAQTAPLDLQWSRANLLPQTARDTECVVMVPAAALSWHAVDLPKGLHKQAGRLQAALHGLLEERVLDDPAQLHMALAPHWKNDPRPWVAVCNKAWLQAHLNALDAAGLTVHRIVPELCPDSSSLHITATGDEDHGWLWLHQSDQGVWGLPLSGLRASSLDLNEEERQTAIIQAEPGVVRLVSQKLQASAQLMSPGQHWLAALSSGWDLAQFEFQTDARARLLKTAQRLGHQVWQHPQWRWARWGLAALLCGQLVGLNVWAWKTRTNWQAQQQSWAHILQETFPQTSVVVDAPLQMKQQMARLRQSSSALAPDDLESMLSALGAALPPPVQAPRQWHYQAGLLRLIGWPLNAQDQQTLQQQLVQPGYRLRAEGDDWLMSPAGSAP